MKGNLGKLFKSQQKCGNFMTGGSKGSMRVRVGERSEVTRQAGLLGVLVQD